MTLISWVGRNDLNSLNSDQLGPIVSTVASENFDRAVLLYNYPQKEVADYLAYLSGRFTGEVDAHEVELSSPIDFTDIYRSADFYLQKLTAQPLTEICILLSPGTPAMQAVWILLGKTRYSVKFYQSTVEQGVQQVDIPFDISAEFIPAQKMPSDEQLKKQVAAVEVPVDAAFDDIITQNSEMITLKTRANIMAQRDIPVLIQGETGTGKELFARAIHNASSRKEHEFVPVNCGAIPQDLIDSVLFGHLKGAFTGASHNKTGLFQQADE